MQTLVPKSASAARQPQTEVLLSVRGLTCRLGGCEVLRDVSFDVSEGEYLSIVGANGAGKSTLLKCLNRIIRSWEGDIQVGGRSMHGCTQREVARLFAYVPQFRGGELPYRVEEFAMMSRYWRHSAFSRPGKADRDVVAAALEQAGIADLAGRVMDTLSGGECQKVFIAGALAQESQILLLDEPSTFLDPRYQHEVTELLRRLNADSGTTVVAVSHDLNAAALCSHRVLALKGGRIVRHCTPAEVMTSEALGEIFDTEFIFADHPGSPIPVVVPAP
ncbi:MAG: ABC transporter ATP-binding protein [Lentisphaeria bacterium]|nr:ABC transporter ATP-binding protein [Lentisphaeria bacterium]